MNIQVVRRRFLRLLSSTLNRATTKLALTGHGPFSLILHVGRTSGRHYQTPVILAAAPGGFVAELTYGENVNWLRNIEAAGGCIVVYRGRRFQITSIQPCNAERGRATYRQPFRLVLTMLRRSHFRLLRTSEASGGI
jgi:deazaflavin-dependent oxidoreductase (nitroreductase family)